MANDDFVQTSMSWHGIFPDHISQRRIIGQLLSLLDKIGQIPKLTVFHDQMYMR
jgi:hypothetical protein